MDDAIYPRPVAPLVAVLLALTGCASAPAWRHSQIADRAAAARQFVIDDGACTLAASGNQRAILPAAANNGPQTVTITGTTFNPATGARTRSSYTGTVTPSSGSGFAAGAAAGVERGAALGALLAAQQSEERIYRGCMYERGWTDAPASAHAAYSDPRPAAAALQPAPDGHRLIRLEALAPVYSDPSMQWVKECEEFLRFFPAYRDTALHALLDAEVKALAGIEKLPTGPQYLVGAHRRLVSSGRVPEVTDPDPGGMRSLYLSSVNGGAASQAQLAIAYMKAADPRTPDDPMRAAHWSRSAAERGSSVGMMGYGMSLFYGFGNQKDRLTGYRLVQQAGSASHDVQPWLTRLQAEMTAAELAAVR